MINRIGALVVSLAFALNACHHAANRSPTPTPAPPLLGFEGTIVHEGSLQAADGVRLFYRMVGAGQDTIVYIHGGPATGMREGYDLEHLTTMGHALLMYDQRGAGLSELVTDTSRLGIDQHVADLGAVLGHFHLQHAKLLGLSWGAAIAARWAGEHQEAVDRVVFLSPISPTQALINARFEHLDSLAGRPGAGGLARRMADAAAPIADSQLVSKCRADRAANTLYRHGGPHAVRPRGDPCDYGVEVLRNRNVARTAGLRSLGNNYDLRPVLQRVRAPSLVVEGELTNVPLEATREFARMLPNGTLALIPDAGHQNWLDRPDAVFPLLDAFFKAR